MKRGKKNKEEIAIMIKGGRKLARIRDQLIKQLRPGITPLEINSLAEKLIAKENGSPSFKKVEGYRWATCICPNEVVVHGIPNKKPFVVGDVVGLDIGFYYQGFHTDTAETVLIKSDNSHDSELTEEMRQKEEFLKVGKKALKLAIDQAVAGNHVGHISQIIQRTIASHGFNVVRNLVGHGIGRKLHEEPEVPGFLNTSIENTPTLEEGMTLAIEVIYNMGGAEVSINSRDGWTVVTRDKSISGLFEHTVLVRKKSPLILTK